MSMDSISSSSLFESTAGKVGGLCSGTIVLGAFITATVYLGIYSFNNPDSEKSWVIKGLDSTSITKAQAI